MYGLKHKAESIAMPKGGLRGMPWRPRKLLLMPEQRLAGNERRMFSGWAREGASAKALR